MLYLMIIEWKKVRLPVSLAVLLLTVAACILTCTLYHNYVIYYDLDAWEVGTDWFPFLFPLFVVLPLCWNLYYERKDHFLLYVLPRISQRKYLMVKWLVQFLCAFFIVLIPHVVSALFALYVKAPVQPYVPKAGYTPFSHIFLEAYTQTPLRYAILLSIWKGIIGGMVLTFGFVLSMYIKNIFVVLTGPFIYSNIEDFLLAILGLQKYRLVVAFDPTLVTIHAISIIAGPVLLLIVIAFTIFFMRKIVRTSVVTV